MYIFIHLHVWVVCETFRLSVSCVGKLGAYFEEYNEQCDSTNSNELRPQECWKYVESYRLKKKAIQMHGKQTEIMPESIQQQHQEQRNSFQGKQTTQMHTYYTDLEMRKKTLQKGL